MFDPRFFYLGLNYSRVLRYLDKKITYSKRRQSRPLYEKKELEESNLSNDIDFFPIVQKAYTIFSIALLIVGVIGLIILIGIAIYQMS